MKIGTKVGNFLIIILYFTDSEQQFDPRFLTSQVGLSTVKLLVHTEAGLPQVHLLKLVHFK